MATLDKIDWVSISRAEARRLIPAADRREQALAAKFDRDEVSETEWWNAFLVWEDLRVLAFTGERRVV